VRKVSDFPIDLPLKNDGEAQPRRSCNGKP
jgi:hypothetical protein